MLNVRNGNVSIRVSLSVCFVFLVSCCFVLASLLTLLFVPSLQNHYRVGFQRSAGAGRDSGRHS